MYQINNVPRTAYQVAMLPIATNVAVAPTINEQRKAAQHREIAASHKRRKRAPPSSVRMLRELRRFFDDRYGPCMPEGDDAALDDFLILLNYVAMLGDYRALQLCKARWAPWLDEATFDRMVDTVVHSPLYLSPDALGARIGLYDAKRTELKIRSIGGVGVDKVQRAARGKIKDAEYQRQRRAEAGATPHAASAARLKPWLADGIGERTWRRRRANQGAGTVGRNSSGVSCLPICPTNYGQAIPTSALPSGKSAADAALSPALGTVLSANDERVDPALGTVSTARVERVFPALEILAETNRDSAFAGRLILNVLKISKNPADNFHLRTPSLEMGCAA